MEREPGHGEGCWILMGERGWEIDMEKIADEEGG